MCVDLGITEITPIKTASLTNLLKSNPLPSFRGKQFRPGQLEACLKMTHETP